jgi:stage V sporulation protein G
VVGGPEGDEVYSMPALWFQHEDREKRESREALMDRFDRRSPDSRLNHQEERRQPMEVTEVKVFPVNEDKLKAYVTITFDHAFIIRDLKVIQGNNGLFVAMPSRKKKDGTFKDIAHPLNNDARQKIEGVILTEYQREIEKSNVIQ